MYIIIYNDGQQTISNAYPFQVLLIIIVKLQRLLHTVSSKGCTSDSESTQPHGCLKPVFLLDTILLM